MLCFSSLFHEGTGGRVGGVELQNEARVAGRNGMLCVSHHMMSSQHVSGAPNRFKFYAKPPKWSAQVEWLCRVDCVV